MPTDPRTPHAESPLRAKPLVVATGLSRGIGLALARVLAPHVTLLSLQRSKTMAPGEGSGDPQRPVPGMETLAWNLSDAPDAARLAHLERALADRPVWGFLHCAGVLGPVGAPAQASNEDRIRYVIEFEEAMRVNCSAGLELCEALIPRLRATPMDGGEGGERPAFLLHLSSGAARNPYVGWDAYCVSKAAMLMQFRALAKRFGGSGPLALSVAPGTVMTDMMRSVLASPESALPDVGKFRALEASGGLVPPEEPAARIATLLLKAPAAELRTLHGALFDVRKGRVELP